MSVLNRVAIGRATSRRPRSAAAWNDETMDCAEARRTENESWIFMSIDDITN